MTTRNDWYRDGTVNVTSGSTTVTGSRTYWSTAGINAGATFRLDGWPYAYEVAEVVSDTEIQLRKAYNGSNLSGQSYSIDPNRSSTILADLAARNANLMGKYEKLYDEDLHTVAGESAYEIAKRLGKTTAATESAWIDELKAGAEYVALKNTVAEIVSTGAGNANSNFVDKNIGLFTDVVSAAIRNGSFSGLHVGNYHAFSNVPYPYYWPTSDATAVSGKTYYADVNGTALSEQPTAGADISGAGYFEKIDATYTGNMRHMDFDYLLRCGDSDLTQHASLVMPDSPMFYMGMNPANTTVGGYAGSNLRLIGMKRAEAIFKACFGADHVLKHREYLVNAVTDGKPTAGAWYDSYCEIPDERMVYGSCIFDSGNPDGQTVYNRYTVSNAQLSAFRYAKYLISNRQYYWLRNVVSAAFFALVCDHGHCAYDNASYAYGVRPAALIY